MYEIKNAASLHRLATIYPGFYPVPCLILLHNPCKLYLIFQAYEHTAHAHHHAAHLSHIHLHGFVLNLVWFLFPY